MITLLAVLRVGAAYVPIDPEYPEARRRFVTDDADLAVLLVESDEAGAEPGAGAGIRRMTLAALDALDGPAEAAAGLAAEPATDRRHDAAYLIYTSGSTGTPKAVVVEHRNVLNLFVGLDRLLTPTEGAVWLAATSLSFDISVLELLWTLHARLCVVVAPLLRLGPDALAAASAPDAARADDAALPSLSLYFFAAAGGAPGEDQPGLYDFVLESVAVADEAGLEAVWFPERHFHEFGGPYANPSVLAAAVATRTSHVQLRAGSVVAALHHPARITEEWSMVDRLSKGRVGVSFASGWMPRDGVLQPAGRSIGRDGMVATVDEVRRLWRGEVLRFASGDGTEFAVTTMPRPVQAELPVWLTSAGSPETFELTGRLGFNMLTHLLGQDVERLAANIERYRNAWVAAGHPGRGRVTLMLHAYLDDDAEEVVRQVHQPMKDYLRSAVGLVGSLATAFPTFATVGHDYDRLFAELDAGEVEVLLDAAATRYEQTAGLFGTQAAALDMLRRVAAVGVDEVACLIDFGVEHDAALAGVGRIAALHHEVERLRAGDGASVPPAARPAFGGRFAELIEREGVTHFQCTPSQATLLVSDPADARALGQLDHLLVGGEALPVSLANELRARVPGRITNVYGPTETTVWSLASEVGPAPIERVSIGTPFANQRIDVVDADLHPVPLGRPGELVISGDGVAWGYRGREELSAQRFIEREGTRWYRTGDLVVVQPDGVVLFLGRADDQVKISGHRIELGDIEAALLATPGIREAAVVVEGSDASARLAAYVVADASGFDVDAVRASLSATLPSVMVPSVLRRLDRLPRTPNGKLDRRAVGAATPTTPVATTAVALPDDVDALVRDAWTEVLGEVAPPDAPFFSVGGNSLLAVRLFRLLEPLTEGRFQLTDVFRYPTMRAMAAHVATLRAVRSPAEDASAGTASSAAATETGAEANDRGARRRAARGR